MKLVIDGRELNVQEGQTVLDAALEAGIYIPHLCKHPDLEAVGGCRLCSIEVEGQDVPVPACMTKVTDGMVVKIHGEKAEKVRRMSMELILATHPSDCTGCPKYGKCELQSMYQYMGVGPERWRKRSRSIPNDDKNPLIEHLFTRCVRCGRCIRVCRDLRGVKVLDFVKGKEGIHAGIPNGLSLEEAGCRFCGACIEVCPTGSIMDAIGIRKEEVPYDAMVVPCRNTCPGGINIPSFVRSIKNGEYEKAVCVIREKVPFPETLGCVCTHTCEQRCKRNQVSGEVCEPISICKLKRFAAGHDDNTWKKIRRKDAPTGKKAAIIGAGPAGLTAAYYLSAKGHAVTVFESAEKAGGQCRYGIPAYRLPDEILDREIGTILENGIALKTNTKISKPAELLNQGYDTVLIAIGTHQGRRLAMEGNHLPGILINTEFLKESRMGTAQHLDGKAVVVLGGGSVAYDCARSAIRLGATKVSMACLESFEQMTASKEEIEEGREEGIELYDAFSFQKIMGESRVEGVALQKIRNFYFDENRKPVMELEEHGEQFIPADYVIFAVGQGPEGTKQMGVGLTHGVYIKTDEKTATDIKGVYAAGDVVTGTKSVIEAIAAGKKCACEMDRYLGGDGDITEKLVQSQDPSPWIGKADNILRQNRKNPKYLPTGERCKSFQPVEEIFDEETAKQEASRCLQCDLRTMLHKPKLWTEY